MSETIGVIADTHGLIRPEALAALGGVDRIIHAGDIGGEQVLAALKAIAPVTYVGGNNDDGTDGLDIVRLQVDFNPASAGPRRFDYPIAVGIIENGRPRHIALDERSVSALERRMNQLSRSGDRSDRAGDPVTAGRRPAFRR